MKTTTLFLLATATTALIAGQSGASDETALEEMRSRIDHLESELDLVRAADENWLTEARAEEIRGLVTDVLADADTRTSLLQDGVVAGFGKNAFLASADGNFKLVFKGQLQVRYVFNHRDQSGGDDSVGGFENRRTKVKFQGHVVDPSWKFEITGAFSRSSGSFGLEEAGIEKDFGNGWSIFVGQHKLPFNAEELISSAQQLTVERSLVNEEFNLGRSDGVRVTYKDDSFKFRAMYSNGAGATGSALTRDTEYAATARAEYLLAGDSMKQFDDHTSWDGDGYAARLGGGVHYEKGEYGTFSGPEEETFLWTVDLSMEFGGANLYAGYIARRFDNADLDQYGFVVQGGMFVDPDRWEIFARYEMGDDDSGREDLSVITVGVNRYYKKHYLKWTTDFGFALDEVTSTWATSGAGWEDDAVGEDGQWVIRSQFQLLF